MRLSLERHEPIGADRVLIADQPSIARHEIARVAPVVPVFEPGSQSTGPHMLMS